MKLNLRALAIASLALTWAIGASKGAEAARVTYISLAGANTGNCATPAAACKTLGFALARTDAGGEVIALTPGNYGVARITQSVMITGVPGAEIRRSTAGEALLIEAGPTDVVTISGFLIDGSGRTATQGIALNSAGTLHVLNCTISNFSSAAINLNPGAALKFLIQDTTVLFNGNEAIGIRAVDGATAIGALVRVTSSNNGFAGMRIRGPGSEVSVSNSTFSGNQSDNILVGAAVGNEVGGFLRITGSTLIGSGTGLRIIAGSTVFSAGDNLIHGNTTNIHTSSGGVFSPVGRQ